MVDREKVEELVDAISETIVEEMEGSGTTASSEVVSALFTVLDRVLNGVRKQPPSAERQHNIALINNNLIGMMIDSGKAH